MMAMFPMKKRPYHIEVLVDCIPREGSSWIGGTWQHVTFLDDLHDVRRVASTCSLRMIGMDRSSTYCFESVVDVSTLVQRILRGSWNVRLICASMIYRHVTCRVDSDLNIVCIGKIQTGVDRRWCRAPIFVKLEATSTGAKDIRDRRLGVGCVSLSAETEVERQIVRGFKHHFDVRRT